MEKKTLLLSHLVKNDIWVRYTIVGNRIFRVNYKLHYEWLCLSRTHPLAIVLILHYHCIIHRTMKIIKNYPFSLPMTREMVVRDNVALISCIRERSCIFHTWSWSFLMPSTSESSPNLSGHFLVPSTNPKMPWPSRRRFV